MCETFTHLFHPLTALLTYLLPPSPPSRVSSSSDSPCYLPYGRYPPGSGMRRYDLGLTREEDAGYVADSSSSSSEYGDGLDGEDRPLLRRGLSFERYGYDPARASVETVILVKK